MHFLGKLASLVGIEALSFSYAPLFFIAHFLRQMTMGECVSVLRHMRMGECVSVRLSL
jgi:hypothetical protein